MYFPAFVLADQGYDVWLANQRGTRYSREHTKLKDSDYKYWLYSLDDLAHNDVPAALDLIANVTGKAGSIVYMGHSRGSTVILMYASSNPVHARRMLKGIVAFSPIAYLDVVWYLKDLIKLGPLIGKVLLFLNISVINRQMEILISLLQVLCGYVPHLCRFALTLSSGRTVHFLPEDLLTFYSHFPSSIATMQLIQYSQMSVSNKFQKYDYGKEENLKKYGQEEPPLYNLTNIIVPLVMYYGKHDILIKEPQVQRINEEVGCAVKVYKSVPIGVEEDVLQYGHNDFIWAGDMRESLYPHLLESLENHMSSK
jgi:lysosomal acid lipase/cholesteryl ester hydrolase